MIKAVIFDADGVLINAQRFSVTLQQDYGISLEKTLPFFNGTFQECLIGKADLKEEVSKHLKDWGWNRSVDEFLRYWFDSEHKIDQEIIKEVKVLKKKGIKCYIGTNNERYRTEYLMNEMGFAGIFDFVFGSGHIGYLKPDPAFFLLITKRIDCQPNEVIFWDNDIENVEGAHKAGLHAEVYTDVASFKKTMQDYLTR